MGEFNQAKKAIQDSNNIYVMPSPNKKETIPVSLALFYSLNKMKKNVNLAIKEIPEIFHFLAPDLNYISSPKKFSLSIKHPDAKIDKIHYKKEEGSINFEIIIKKGTLKKNNIRFEVLRKKPDLLITMGIDNLKQINKNSILEKINSNLTILNIDDNKPQDFAKINLVKNKYSLPETAISLIKSIDTGLIDKKTASCFLAGLIVSSDNFQNDKTSPKTFKMASFLKEKGASHQKIVSSLFKSKPLSQIKILGEILKNINFHSPAQTYWAVLTPKKMPFSQNSELKNAVEDLRKSFSNSPNLLLLEKERSSRDGRSSHALGSNSASRNSPTVEPKVQGLFYSPKKDLIERVSSIYQGKKKKDQLYFTTQTLSPKNVKNKILNVLAS